MVGRWGPGPIFCACLDRGSSTSTSHSTSHSEDFDDDDDDEDDDEDDAPIHGLPKPGSQTGRPLLN